MCRKGCGLLSKCACGLHSVLWSRLRKNVRSENACTVQADLLLLTPTERKGREWKIQRETYLSSLSEMGHCSLGFRSGLIAVIMNPHKNDAVKASMNPYQRHYFVVSFVRILSHTQIPFSQVPNSKIGFTNHTSPSPSPCQSRLYKLLHSSASSST